MVDIEVRAVGKSVGASMDFAKKQLEKYGWQEGKGLGKNENGISTALKPNLKFDTAGVGHSSSEEFTNNWWENLYNKASNNLNIVTAESADTIQVKVKNPDAVEISTKNYSVKNLKKERNGLQYGSFIKTSKLTAEGTVHFDNNFRNLLVQTDIPSIPTPTDEELFAACGGRTAHKGARHGLKLNGKLSRLEKQERLLLKKLKKVNLSDETETKSSKKNLEKKLKKIDYHKSKNKSEVMEDDIDILSPARQFALGSNSPQKSSKKRKKERKRVSFSETVTEYQTQDTESKANTSQTQDLDSSSQSDGSSRPPTPITTVRKLKIKDTNESSDNNANLLGDLDEGIDCSDFDSTKDANKEKSNTDLQAKIRKDNQRMKRKLNKLRRHDGQVPNKDVIDEKEENKHDVPDSCLHCAKRKINFEFEDCEEIEAKKCHYELGHLTKKQLKRYFKKQKRLEKRIAKVTDTFNQICKISDVESE